MTPPVGEPTRGTGLEFTFASNFCSGPRLSAATGLPDATEAGTGLWVGRRRPRAGFAAANVLEKGGKNYRIGFPPVTAIVAPDT